MPELPEVETIKNELLTLGLPGRRIAGVEIGWARSIEKAAPDEFRENVEGRTIGGILRRGKYIIFRLDPAGFMTVHLRMSGRLELVSSGFPRDKHHHVVLSFDDGRELRLHDTRKFGRVRFSADIGWLERKLGPEPLAYDFGAAEFRRMITGRSRMLKALLLDQSFIAGIGNIYADEALWRAKLHPLRLSDSLDGPEADRLYHAVRESLQTGIDNLGTSLGSGEPNYGTVSHGRGRNGGYLGVFRRTGLPCPVCGTPVERIRAAQRSTHFCPKCQRV